MLRISFFFAFLLAALTQTASAQQISAVAISPDGGTLLIAGDNRVLYTMDAATMEITGRRYVPEQIQWLRYSEDGNSVYLRGQDRSFAAHDAESFKRKFGADKIVAVSYAPAAGRLALLENNYKGGVLHVVAATSGKRVRSIEMPELRTDEVVLSADAFTALMLTNSESSDTEEKAQPGSELKGYDKYDFRQRHDGYISKLVSADLKNGTFQAVDTWYRVSNPNQVRLLDGKVAIVNSVSDSGLIGADGQAMLINLGDNFVSFAQITAAGDRIVLTNGRELRIHPLADGVAGEAGLTLKADDLPGPAERVTAMAEAGDGTFYFGTSAYRVWKLAPGATEIAAVPVF